MYTYNHHWQLSRPLKSPCGNDIYVYSWCIAEFDRGSVLNSCFVLFWFALLPPKSNPTGDPFHCCLLHPRPTWWQSASVLSLPGSPLVSQGPLLVSHWRCVSLARAWTGLAKQSPDIYLRVIQSCIGSKWHFGPPSRISRVERHIERQKEQRREGRVLPKSHLPWSLFIHEADPLDYQ